jgi:hypothetical protein
MADVAQPSDGALLSDGAQPSDGAQVSDGTQTPTRPALLAAGAASMAAGAIHAVAAGAHNGSRQAMWAFALLAALQLAWGAWALARPSKPGAACGAALGVVALAGWAAAVALGIPWIDGFEDAVGVGTADALAAGLAAVSVVLCVVAMYGLPSPRALGPALAAIALVVAVPGMAAAATHSHGHGEGSDHDEVADGHDHPAGEASGETAAGAEHADHAAAAVPPQPYDPALPIDLSGVEGVTPGQQAAAENLVSATLIDLPQFADTAVAEAHGFRSIGDGSTGYEHYINRSYINDDKILDPDYPESLVFQNRNGQKTLVAAMFMLPSDATLDDVPELGGTLTQWHIHDNLCYTPDPVAPRVAGLREPGGPCTPPLVPGGENPMIHVWIVPHECGPFAALDGIAGGTIAQGEERWCDHAHGA